MAPISNPRTTVSALGPKINIGQHIATPNSLDGAANGKPSHIGRTAGAGSPTATGTAFAATATGTASAI